MLIVNQTDAAAHGGEALDAVQKANGQTAPEAKPPAQEAPAEPPSDSTSVPSDDPQEEPQPDETDPAEPAGEEPTEPQPEVDPEIDTPDESDASYAGSVVVVGDRAMEIPTRLDDIITSYAAAVGNLAKALGPDVRTISLVTPNGGEFYSPESLHTGEHSQKDMIDFCYGQMDSGIVTVDAYAKLRAHTDEYIYFRTDHHWTQLGAYYAYTAFCEAAGFDAVPLKQFQTGRYDTFLGSMYTFTKGYPQSDVLKQHPDYLDYYLPIADTHARYYADGSLENGTPVSVVYTQLDESVSNKYLCFIGGDTPVCIVESDVQGPDLHRAEGILRQRLRALPHEPLRPHHRHRPARVQPGGQAHPGPRRLRRRPGCRRPDRHQLPLHDQQQSLRPLPQRIGGGQMRENAAAPAFPS